MPPKQVRSGKAEETSSRKVSSQSVLRPSQNDDNETSQLESKGAKSKNRISGEDKSAYSTHHPTFEIPSEGKSITAQRFALNRSTQMDDTPALIFTHGAGGGITNPATSLFARGFAKRSDIVLYQGTMNLQSRVKACNAVIDYCHGGEAALGGRSMGARAAVISAQHHSTKALVLASYPLVGQTGEVRDQILLDIDADVDVLFISGDRDHMCGLEQLQKVRERMKAKTWLAVVEGADHGLSLKPKGAVEPMREYAGEVAAMWLQERSADKTSSILSWNATEKKVNDLVWKTSVVKKASSIQDAFAKARKRTDSAAEPEGEPAKKRRKKG